jgi:hypothetical protein
MRQHILKHCTERIDTLEQYGRGGDDKNANGDERNRKAEEIPEVLAEEEDEICI